MCVEEDYLEREIQKRQEVLDKHWYKRRFYINGHEVSYEEYEAYQEMLREDDARVEGNLSFFRRCTSTGEEWETDSDGDYTPGFLYDEL